VEFCVSVPATSPAPPPLFEDNRPTSAALEALLAHPEFPEAMRAIAAGLVTLYGGGNRLFNAVVTDRWRYLMGLFALYLHFGSRPGDPRFGLTAARMRSLCEQHRICSPGRAETTLVVMRFFGLLAPAPNETDRRLRRLVPSERLIAWYRARCAFMLDATAKLLPEGAQALVALPSAEFFARFIRQLAETFFNGFRYVDHAPDAGIFIQRSAGAGILMQLMLSGDPGDGFPPRRPVSISLSELARKFGVSRVHVRRLLNDSVSGGLLERTGAHGESFLVLPRLADAARNLLATYILHNAHCARAALAEQRDERAIA
jgi:AraC-like DNA-binding protein